MVGIPMQMRQEIDSVANQYSLHQVINKTKQSIDSVKDELKAKQRYHFKIIFLGSSHVAKNYGIGGGKPVSKNDNIREYELDKISIDEKSNSSKQGCAYVFSGPNAVDLGTSLTIHQITETATPILINKINELLTSNTDNDIHIQITGSSRGGVIASNVYDYLTDVFKNNTRVKFRNLEKYDEYAGPINSRILDGLFKTQPQKEKQKSRFDLNSTGNIKDNVSTVEHNLANIYKSVWIVSLCPRRNFNNISINENAKTVILTISNHRGTSVVGPLFHFYTKKLEIKTENMNSTKAEFKKGALGNNREGLWIHLGNITFQKPTITTRIKNLFSSRKTATVPVVEQIKNNISSENEEWSSNKFKKINTIEELINIIDAVTKTIQEKHLVQVNTKTVNVFCKMLFAENSDLQKLGLDQKGQKLVEQIKVKGKDTQEFFCEMLQIGKVGGARGIRIINAMASKIC